MVKRIIESDIVHSLRHFPVAAILGSRQVGKTTLAKNIQKNHKTAVYLDLELPSDLNKLRDPELYLKEHEEQLVIIDEIQRMPDLFPVLRALVDQKRKRGRFLILGSASPALMKNSSESLAGRIVYHELSPFSIEEVGSDSAVIQKLWLRGGYPKSFLAPSHKESFRWREAFIQSFLERDLPQLGIHVSALQLRRFLTMIAHSHGQLWNASAIARSLGISAPAISRYLDIFESTFWIRRLLPYHANLKKRLVKSPKIYIRDSGLLHHLLENSTWEALQAYPGVGNSWEGFAVEQILKKIPQPWRTYFFRTAAGAEIDLVIFKNQEKPIAIEIKYSLSPKVSKEFWNAYRDLRCQKGFILYPGHEAYPIQKDVQIWPMAKLEQLMKSIRR